MRRHAKQASKLPPSRPELVDDEEEVGARHTLESAAALFGFGDPVERPDDRSRRRRIAHAQQRSEIGGRL